MIFLIKKGVEWISKKLNEKSGGSVNKKEKK